MNAVVKTHHGEVRAHKVALGWMRATLSEHRHPYGDRDRQELQPRVQYQRFGCLTGMCIQADLSRCLL